MDIISENPKSWKLPTYNGLILTGHSLHGCNLHLRYNLTWSDIYRNKVIDYDSQENIFFSARIQFYEMMKPGSSSNLAIFKDYDDGHWYEATPSALAHMLAVMARDGGMWGTAVVDGDAKEYVLVGVFTFRKMSTTISIWPASTYATEYKFNDPRLVSKQKRNS